MKITNRIGLPRQFAEAAAKDSHPLEPHRYYVTELLRPVKAILVRRNHDAELEQDVADMIPAMFGSAFHAFMEANAPKEDGIKAEFKVEAKFGEDTVSGMIDAWNANDGEIWDYKTCSVGKVTKRDFEDWRMQGLMYALLLWKSNGSVTKKLRFYAIMKDWSKIKAAAGGNYPQSAVYVWEYDVAESDYDYIELWVRSRLVAVNSCLDTQTYPECTPDECWHTGDKWAVYRKQGDKRAIAVCDSEEEAAEAISAKCGGSGFVEPRPGEALRCKYYCECRKWCEGEKK